MKSSQPSALRRGLSVVGKLLVGTRKGPSGDRVRQLKKLERKIGIKFTDLGLLEQALTHRSYSHVTSQTRNQSNERMEFLGDSVLGLSVSQFLYLQFPDRSEGALSKMKSLLVSRKVLSAVSRDAGLGEFLLLSGEESEMGGRDRSSILADSFEGVIGAIYLDQGFRAANKFIQRFLLGAIHEILKDEEHINFKSLLQEFVQSKRLSHPVYRVRREEGPEHEKEFAVEVVVRGDVWGIGRGKSKKDAEQNAARAALESRQSREGTRRSGRDAETAPADRPPRAGRDGGGERGERRERSERGERSERSERSERGERRPRERREPREAREPREPRNAAPQDRGEHGILASREKLRSVRREEAEQRRREDREFRERRDERGRPERAPAEEPARAEGGRADLDRTEAARPEAARSEGGRAEGGRRSRGGRGRGGRGDRGQVPNREGRESMPAASVSASPEAFLPSDETVAPEELPLTGSAEVAPPAPLGTEESSGGTASEEARERGFGRRRRRRGRGGRADELPRRDAAPGGMEAAGSPSESQSAPRGFPRDLPDELPVGDDEAIAATFAWSPPAATEPSATNGSPQSEAARRDERLVEPAVRAEVPYDVAEDRSQPLEAHEAPESMEPMDDADADAEPHVAGMARHEGGFSRRKRRHAKGLRRR